MVPIFPVLHFPPLQFGADNSSPAFSSLAFSAPPSLFNATVIKRAGRQNLGYVPVMYQFTERLQRLGPWLTGMFSGAWCDGSFLEKHKIIYVVFCFFSNFRKVGKFAASIERLKAKGCFLPLDPVYIYVEIGST